MKNIPHISDTEWIVMKELWKKSPVTANEIVALLKARVNWKPKTIKTLLNRLLKKEVIGFEKEKRSYLYHPLFSESECVLAENESFLEKVHGGALNSMLASFVDTNKFSKKEIEELKSILDGKKQ